MLKEITEKYSQLLVLEYKIKAMLGDMENNYDEKLVKEFFEVVYFYNACTTRVLDQNEKLLFDSFTTHLTRAKSEIAKILRAIYQALIDNAQEWNHEFIPKVLNDYSSYLGGLPPKSLRAHLDAAQRTVDQFYPWLTEQVAQLSFCCKMVLPDASGLIALKNNAETMLAINENIAIDALAHIQEVHKAKVQVSALEEHKTIVPVKDLDLLILMLSPPSEEKMKELNAPEIQAKIKFLSDKLPLVEKYIMNLHQVKDADKITQLNNSIKIAETGIEALEVEYFSRRVQRDTGVLRALHLAAISLNQVLGSSVTVPPLQQCPGNAGKFMYGVWLHQNTDLQSACLNRLLKTVDQGLLNGQLAVDFTALRATLEAAKNLLIQSALKGTEFLPGLSKGGQISKNPMPSHKQVVKDQVHNIGMLIEMTEWSEQYQKLQVSLTESKSNKTKNKN